MKYCQFRLLALPAGLALGGLAASGAQAQGWVQFNNESASRIIATPGLSTTDPEEKDYAFGDLDKDGDIDLVCVRKTGFTVFGPKRSVLFMNEGVKEGLSMNGVLVDRTNEFATAADDGGQGFLDLTNNRNVAVVDVNGDSWLDVVTLTALGQSQPKTLSHPRVYINLKNSESGAWLGLKYENARIPSLPTSPNGCGVAVGDVTGDGAPEIYMVDYNQSMGDRLLINDGNGFFSDQTSTRMSPAMIQVGFGTAGVIADVNGDGVKDLMKSENGPFKTIYNNPSNQGFFNKITTPSSGSHYNMSSGDLNNDGKADFIISDDGSDRYLLNDGLNADGTSKFISKTYSFQSGGDDGIGGNSASADLNNDGWNDVVICDVDVDIPGCDQRAHIYRNLGNAPSVTLQEQGQVIPNANLKGMHDIAIFDINGDGWKDMVLGRCSGMQVWMNKPPFGLVYTYPNGLPGFLTPGQTTPLTVQMSPIGGGQVIAGSERIFVSVDGGPLVENSLTPIGENLYQAVLPALNCTESLGFYISADLDNGGTFLDPPAAPTQLYTTIATLGTEITFRDEVEGDISSWGIFDGTGVGTWQQADPNGSISLGKLASPEDDATSAFDAFKAFVTLNGPPGAAANLNDVDGGPFALISPVVEVFDADAIISFSAWMFCDDKGTAEADTLHVEISNGDRTGWQPAFEIEDTNSAWKNFSFLISDYITPTDQVRIRFLVKDIPNNSVTEAGIDNFQIEAYLCPTGQECLGDLDASGEIDGGDLGLLLGAWGTADFVADLDHNGDVDGADLGMLLGGWGLCP